MRAMRLLLPTALVLAFAGALLPRLATAGTEPIEPPTPMVIGANDEEVAAITERVERAKAEKDDTLLVSALRDMNERRHAAFVPIIREALASKNLEVQARACSAAASNEMYDDAKTVRKVLAAGRKRQKGKGGRTEGTLVVTCALDYLGRAAVEGDEELAVEVAKEIFDQETRVKSEQSPELLRVVLLYLGKVKADKSVPFLVELVKEPAPVDPNDPNNPPASYWEARFKLWQAYESWARWALKEITGQEFRTHREWAAWLNENKKKYR